MKNAQKLQKNKEPEKVQILSELISCDSDYDDSLSFCLLTLDAKAIKTILDTHLNWCALFPDALEIAIQDKDFWAAFLSADEAEVLSLGQEEEYRVITEKKDFIIASESDNDREAWDITLRKIVICKEDVRVVGLYDFNHSLKNAFTASQMIPVAVFKNLYASLVQKEGR